MKKAIEYLNKANKPFESCIKMTDRYINEEAALIAIRFAQVEAIKETVKWCAENASLDYADGKCELPVYAEEAINATCDELDNWHYISRESILSVADKLIKIYEL